MAEPQYLFKPTIAAVPVAGQEPLFPVRRIYCVGRNYAEHIREMGGDERQPPFFFQKPTDAIVLDGSQVPYPSITFDFQHEIELVLAIGAGGTDISTADAGHHVLGVAVGIDLTRRDVQVEARKAGRPWEIGKSFDRSAPIGPICPIALGRLPDAGEISLSVNSEIRQKGDLQEMIWKPAEIIAQISRHYRLEAGDLIYTGTPAGVGPIEVGDQVQGCIAGIGRMEITVVSPV